MAGLNPLQSYLPKINTAQSPRSRFLLIPLSPAPQKIQEKNPDFPSILPRGI
jgi:hypothetical protein